MGMAYIRGIQKNNVYATGKHFVAYGTAEKGFNWAQAQIPERTMREVYLAPFEAAIKEAGLKAIMPAYQENDGEPCHPSKKLLVDILRKDFGFDGLIVTDYAGLDLLHSFHKLFPDLQSVSKRSIECGIDVELPRESVYGKILIEEIKKGNIKETDVDIIVERVLTKKFELGLFENPYIDENLYSCIRSKESLLIAKEITKETISLLENKNNILPLDRNKKQKIAVIGPSADCVRNYLGDYAFKAHVDDGLVKHLKSKIAGEAGTPFALSNDKLDLNMDLFSDFIKDIEGTSIYDAICQKVGAEYVSCSVGSDIFETTDEMIKEAVETAKNNDIIIAVLGDRAGLTDGSSSGESRDRRESWFLRWAG